ncbi:hypothetical protein Cpap_4023 [Ruminiclostridium papyrosolvens DSM 2782]|uniref:DUF4238 domain-containing protein n=1 Tax=Ruminiclostridium papyrosolvens DSM 2782 TaxID=588581 RepID=F1T7Y7_9FIRM|nr:DUF4238 domain-containing protein [Ruminiclostridium papyrosolvens]EGD49585.1 hypothetical protein Cpap_4023 [Ruminiclostridium papyrosolvens DSM 2782]WES33289.1 DUF4238 domain-containing protein [Ruminiclostridium papyrosolvens DSM 2782]
MEKRNHHYVPQFYLNYFTDPSTPSIYSPYVWVYDKADESIKNKAPKNIAYEKGYNDIEDSEGNISSIVEDQFEKEIETPVSRVFRKLVKLNYISRSERLMLCKFVFSMVERVPKFSKTFKVLIESGRIKELSIKGIDYDNLSSKVMMDSVVRVTHVASHLLLRMSWSLLIAQEGTSFITSDNPVVIKDPDNLNMELCGFASSPQVEVTFPLTQKICLFGSWGRYRRIIEQVNADEVKEINFETFKYSHKYLFSSSKNFAKEILIVNNMVNNGLIC